MKLHVLKIKDEYIREIYRGSKTFELRKDDRDYEIGDLIHFVNIDGEESILHRDNQFKITYILRNVPEYGLQDGYAILSIYPVRY